MQGAEILVEPLVSQLGSLITELADLQQTFSTDATDLVSQIDELSQTGAISGDFAAKMQKEAQDYQTTMQKSLGIIANLQTYTQNFQHDTEQAAKFGVPVTQAPGWFQDDHRLPIHEDGMVEIAIEWLTLHMMLEEGDADTLASGAMNYAREILSSKYPGQRDDSDDLHVATTRMSQWIFNTAEAYNLWTVNVDDLDTQASAQPLPQLAELSSAEQQQVAALSQTVAGELNAGETADAPLYPIAHLSDADRQRIINTFSDPRTQELLFELMSSNTGYAYGEYLLAIGSKTGGKNIQWSDSKTMGKDAVGESQLGGVILLNADWYTPGGQGNRPYMASVLIHESIETYFDMTGIRPNGDEANVGKIVPMGTKRADYVAEWFAGQYLREMQGRGEYNGNVAIEGPPGSYASLSADASSYGSYGQSFDSWLKNDGKNYSSETTEIDPQFFNKQVRPGDFWLPNDYPAYVPANQVIHIGDIPNPMGLSVDMLKPGADLGKLSPPATPHP